MSKLLFYYNKLLNQLPYIPRTISLIYKASKNITVSWFFLILIQGLLPLIFIYTVKNFIDTINNTKPLKESDLLYSVLPQLSVVVLIIFLSEILKTVTKNIRIYQGELVRDHIQGEIHRKSLSLDLSFFESSEFYNKLYRAKIDAISRPVALLENLGQLIQNSITLISVLSVLFLYKWWIPLLLILGFIPVLPLLIYQTLKFHEWKTKSTIEQRKILYYDYLLTERESAAEIRLFNLGNYFQNLFINTTSNLRNQYKKINNKQLVLEFFSVSIGLVIFSFIIVWSLFEALNGRISVGSIVMIYLALDKAQKSVNILFTNITETYKNIMFIENLFEFLDIKINNRVENKESMPFIINNSIKINNVFFKYPFSDRTALNGLNMVINSGKITAIVGTNGAGKSTLIKMLCRFYDPESGNIEVDGIDYKNFSKEEIQKNTVVLFQDYLKFNMKVSENIGLGNYTGIFPSMEEIKKAAENSGSISAINRLDNKFDNMLGRWFQGAELSIGEWQKIALARVFIKDAELIIFDEPTSAMDSWAEAEWIERFKERVKGHTSVIITHRFTTAMQADMIYVMDKGKVIEEGTHQELMALNGEYAKSWKKQINNENIFN